MMKLEALRVPLSEDLRPLSSFLGQHRVRHQISEQQGDQVLWVADQDSAALVQNLYRRLANGELVLEAREREAPQARRATTATTFLPVTLLLIVASLIGAALTRLSPELASLLSYYRLTPVEQGYMVSVAPGEYWRWFTPVFLHYGLLHITFNALWVWELGRRIEFQHGSVRLLLLTLVMGVGSNLAQVWYTPGQLFGGMSGVIYGYLGYIIVCQSLAPTAAFALPKGIVIFMLAWLFICMAGFTELVGLGAIANAAHVGGLIAGLLLALPVVLWRRLNRG